VVALGQAALAGVRRKRAFSADLLKTEKLLAAMKARLDARGVRLLLLFIPDQDPELYRRSALLRAYDRLLMGTTAAAARARLRLLCEARGIAYCQLSGRFEAAEQAARMRLQDTHFNAAGHAAAAEELLSCVQSLGF
jgi:hypothetical protein